MKKYKFKFTAETAPRTFSEKPGDNYIFLASTQNLLNLELEPTRIITLNDVLHSLGMQEIGEDGNRVGWRYTDGDFIDLRVRRIVEDEFQTILATEFILEPNCKPL